MKQQKTLSSYAQLHCRPWQLYYFHVASNTTITATTTYADWIVSHLLCAGGALANHAGRPLGRVADGGSGGHSQWQQKYYSTSTVVQYSSTVQYYMRRVQYSTVQYISTVHSSTVQRMQYSTVQYHHGSL